MGDGIVILHVDDDPAFTDLTETFLEREDDRFVVETATSAGEAMDRLAETTVDCIGSDSDMPKQNGIAFVTSE